MSYESLAIGIMFGRVEASEFGPKYGLEYRKGKTFLDVKKAVSAGIAAGHAKVEFELNMIEVQLKRVLKPIKVKHETPK